MEYTVNKLAKLAGVSTRTLRYYDEYGILKPVRLSSSGYRIYGRHELEMLQQILFFRELDFSLEEIKAIITSPDFDRLKSLRKHHKKLIDKKTRLEKLIKNVEKSIEEAEGRINMTDKEKFEGFKQKLIDENELKYGAEIREKYGAKKVEWSNKKFKNLTKEQFDQANRLSEEIFETLAAAIKTGNPAGELAQKAAELHKEWLTFFWSEYSGEAHAGLAKMYVDDERFKAFYDKNQPGTAEFLRDAILIYTGQKK